MQTQIPQISQMTFSRLEIYHLRIDPTHKVHAILASRSLGYQNAALTFHRDNRKVVNEIRS
jgi:hypothetical protein